MKKIFSLSLWLLLLLGVSCAPQNDGLDDVSLNLSEKELVFDNAAATKSVNVSSSQAKWIASCPMEGQWVELVQTGNTLEVKVDANTQGKERKTFILVDAGGAAEKIVLKQSAADVLLEAMPQSIIIPKEGGRKSIDIKSNTESWTASLSQEVDWLKVVSRVQAGEVVLEALPNRDNQSRSVKLIARSGAKVIEVPIVQQGKQKYILPIFKKEVRNIDQLIKEEIERGSIMIRFNGHGAFGDQIIPGQVTFVPSASQITTITYTFQPSKDNKMIDIINHSMEAQELSEFKSDEFKAYMKENGFAFEFGTDKIISYTNEKLSFEAQISASEQQTAMFRFSSYIPQGQAYPTLKELPLSIHKKALNKKNVKRANILEYETELGSTLAEEDYDLTYPDEIRSMTFSAKKPEHALSRLYFFYNSSDNIDAPIEWIGTAKQINSQYDDAHLGAWQTENGRWVMTREMRKLLAENGFTYSREREVGTQTWFVYQRAEDNLTMAVIPDKEKDGKTYLYIITTVIGFNYQETQTAGARQAMSHTDEPAFISFLGKGK